MNKSDAKMQLNQMTPGMKVDQFFVLRSVELKNKRDGKPFLSLNVGDASGRIPGNLWDDAQRWYDMLRPGDIVQIKGKIGTFRESPQLTIDTLRKATPEDDIDPADFIAKAPMDIEAAFNRLMDLVHSIQHQDLHRLLTRVFEDEARVRGFKAAPGGKLWHHAYAGGLLEHTLNVVTVCDTMASLYDMVDRDLLITGAILHDIGKLEEYDFAGGFIDFTDEGRLLGHITLGAMHIRTLIEDIEKEHGFDGEVKQLLLHLILSHQGKKEHGSPVLPAIPEAMILYYADEMDSKANALRRIKERDAAPGRKWSQFIQLLDRYVYLREPKADTPESNPHWMDEAPAPQTPPIPSEPAGKTQSTLFD